MLFCDLEVRWGEVPPFGGQVEGLTALIRISLHWKAYPGLLFLLLLLQSLLSLLLFPVVSSPSHLVCSLAVAFSVSSVANAM